MDLSSLSFSVCVIMICLPGVGYCSNGGTDDCPCPAIPTHNLTQPADQKCRQIGDRYRYNCVAGYVRTAGTSNLIKCSKAAKDAGAKWSNCTLVCKPDPRIPVTKPPTTTATKTAHTDTPHDIIITTTVTPSTSQLTTHSVSISVSTTAKTESTEPTSSGPVQWSLSDQTQGENLDVTHESVTVTSATARTMSTSTLSLSTVTSNITAPEHRTGRNTTTAAVISCVSLVIIIFAVIVLYYKRRSINNMLVQTEAINMNRELSSEPAVQCLMSNSDKESLELKGSSPCCEESVIILQSGENV